MKNHIKSVVVLTSICAFVAILMAVTNYITAPIIEKNQKESANAALLEVFPDGEGFEELDISEYEMPDGVRKAYSEKSGGYVFEVEVTGYKPGLVIVCGVSKDGKVTGATCVQSSETNGAEKTYGSKVKGATLDDIDDVDTVSGSTKTTAAYRSAVKKALNAKKAVGGEAFDDSADKTPEQLLFDNLANALPDAKGEFTNVLVTEQLSADYLVFKANNETGYVFVSGENFVATDAGGTVISEVEAEVKAAVEADAKKLLASGEPNKVYTKGENEAISPLVDEIYKTSSGVYVIKIRANGYGITGDKYVRSNQPIKLEVAITKDGKMISCLTTFQAESEGIGDVCAQVTYYGNFTGKTSETYTEVETKAGATVTTTGYMNAIKAAFGAVKIMEGGK